MPRLGSEPTDVVVRQGVLRLREYPLALDAARPVEFAWASHAHADHVAAHARTLCTPTTAALLQALGVRTHAQPLDLHRPIMLGPYRLTQVEAGHVPGASQLLIEVAERRTLVTGDLGRSGMRATPAPLPMRCTELVLDATYGDPSCRYPAAAVARAELCAWVEGVRATGHTPVVMANPLGRAQEVCATLLDAGFALASTPHVVSLTRAAGLNAVADALRPYKGRPPADSVVVLPLQARALAQRWARVKVLAVTGMRSAGTAATLGADAVIRLVDHADFDELCAWVATCEPRMTWTWGTHAAALATALRGLGHDAAPLEEPAQQSLL